MGNDPTKSQQLQSIYSPDQYTMLQKDVNFPSLTIIAQRQSKMEYALLARKGPTSGEEGDRNVIACLERREVDGLFYERYEWAQTNLEGYLAFLDSFEIELGSAAEEISNIISSTIRGFSYLSNGKGCKCLEIFPHNIRMISKVALPSKQVIIKKPQVKIIPLSILNQHIQLLESHPFRQKYRCKHYGGNLSDVAVLGFCLLELCCKYLKVQMRGVVVLQLVRSKLGANIAEIIKNMIDGIDWSQAIYRFQHLFEGKKQQTHQKIAKKEVAPSLPPTISSPQIYSISRHQTASPIIPHQNAIYNHPPFIRDITHHKVMERKQTTANKSQSTTNYGTTPRTKSKSPLSNIFIEKDYKKHFDSPYQPKHPQTTKNNRVSNHQFDIKYFTKRTSQQKFQEKPKKSSRSPQRSLEFKKNKVYIEQGKKNTMKSMNAVTFGASSKNQPLPKDIGIHKLKYCAKTKSNSQINSQGNVSQNIHKLKYLQASDNQDIFKKQPRQGKFKEVQNKQEEPVPSFDFHTPGSKGSNFINIVDFNQRQENIQIEQVESDQSSPLLSSQKLKNARYVGSHNKSLQKQGTGKLYFKDGSSYAGEFSKDKLEGRGKVFYPSGYLAYEGLLKNNQIAHYGKIYNQNPAYVDYFDCTDFSTLQNQKACWKFFQGEIKKSMKNGKGILMLQNGEKYEGAFLEDKVHGYGTFFGKNRTIKGKWIQNKLHQIISE